MPSRPLQSQLHQPPLQMPMQPQLQPLPRAPQQAPAPHHWGQHPHVQYQAQASPQLQPRSLHAHMQAQPQPAAPPQGQAPAPPPLPPQHPLPLLPEMMGMGIPHVALQPLQIVFQQGLGNLAHVIPTMVGDAMAGAHIAGAHLAVPLIAAAAADAHGGPLGMPHGHLPPGHGGSTGSGATGSGVPGEALPWRDLRRLHQHLGRLLGRTGQHRALPPANMPAGELHAFLGALQGTTAQLSVAMSDLQGQLGEGATVQPRQRLQFAMALVAAARTFRGVATVMQSGFVEGGPGHGGTAPVHGADHLSNGAAMATAVPAAGIPGGGGEATSAHAEGPPSAVDRGDVPIVNSASVEAAAEAGRSRPSTEDLVLSDSSEEEPAADEAGPQARDTTAAASAVSAAGVASAASSAGTPGAARQGSAPRCPFLEPPHLGADEQPQAEGAIGWAWGPPALASRDEREPPSASVPSVGSGAEARPPAADPAQLLQQRWASALGGMEGLPDLPPPAPMHLAHLYLGAILRDAGRLAAADPEYAALPQAEAVARFPHLSQLANHFAGGQVGAGRHGPSPPSAG